MYGFGRFFVDRGLCRLHGCTGTVPVGRHSANTQGDDMPTGVRTTHESRHISPIYISLSFITAYRTEGLAGQLQSKYWGTRYSISVLCVIFRYHISPQGVRFRSKFLESCFSVVVQISK